VVNEPLTFASRHKYSVNGHLKQGNPRPVPLPECLVDALDNEEAQAGRANSQDSWPLTSLFPRCSIPVTNSSIRLLAPGI
jgi:hypothetical protein